MASSGQEDEDNIQGSDDLEMRLLLLDEPQRSRIMHKVVKAFQEKVLLCCEQFRPDITLSCLRIITSMSARKLDVESISRGLKSASKTKGESSPTQSVFSEVDVEEALTRELPNFTISRLRSTVQQLLRRASMRQDGSLYFGETSQCPKATQSVQYFVWFFDFMDYLQDLYVGFNENIFSPLHKFFVDNDNFSKTRRKCSISSAFSRLTHFSGSSTKSSPTAVEADDLEAETHLKRSKTSLVQLGSEYKEIKAIYDTSDIEKVSQRLSIVKDELEYLFDEEDEVDPEFYSDESYDMIEHLDMDFGTENFIRLVPDILVKFKQIIRISNRWLDLDDQRTKDADSKLFKLTEIELKLKERLKSLNEEIVRGEEKLEQETNELSRLMERESRSDRLTYDVYDSDNQIRKLKQKHEKLVEERDTFAPKLSEVVKTKNMKEFQRLKFCFESNKLRRFLIERKLATLDYQRSLFSDDLSVELHVRPSVIHSTNKLQEDCERLEKRLREQHNEAINIKHALLPVQEDRASLEDHISHTRQGNSQWIHHNNVEAKQLPQHSTHALYVKSLPIGQNDSLPHIDKHASYVQSFPIGKNDNNVTHISNHECLITELRHVSVGNTRIPRTLEPIR